MKANFAEIHRCKQPPKPAGRLSRSNAWATMAPEAPLDGAILNACDTLIVVGFDSLRTGDNRQERR